MSANYTKPLEHLNECYNLNVITRYNGTELILSVNTFLWSQVWCSGHIFIIVHHQCSYYCNQNRASCYSITKSRSAGNYSGRRNFLGGEDLVCPNVINISADFHLFPPLWRELHPGEVCVCVCF